MVKETANQPSPAHANAVRSADRREGVSDESHEGARRHRRLDAQHDSAAGIAGDARKLLGSMPEIRRIVEPAMQHSTNPQKRKAVFTDCR
jgi:hypothetical protein